MHPARGGRGADRRRRRRAAGRMPLQYGGELFHEGIEAHFQTAHLVGETVVGHHGGDCREEADRRGHQRLGDAGRDRGERRLLDIAERGERRHDAPYRAEEADIRAGGAHGGERRQAVFQPVDLLQLRHAHRPPRALEELIRGDGSLLALARELAKAELEDARHADRAAVRLDRAIKLREIAAGPEVVLELIRLARRAPEHESLPEDDGPGSERGEEQQPDDDLYGYARLDDQASIPVQIVVGLLLLASLTSWAIIFRKRLMLGRAAREADQFENNFWSGGDLTQLYRAIESHGGAT